MDHENKWVEDYIELMRKNDDVKFFILKEKHFPLRFYKYRSLNETTFACLENNYLWASEAKELNDPFESSLIIDHNEVTRSYFTSETFKDLFKLTYKYDFPHESVKEILSSKDALDTVIAECKKYGIKMEGIPTEQFEKASSEWEQLMTEHEKLIRICSFGTSYESLLMWAHYADNHRGVCLEYDFRNDLNIRTFMQPVYYSDKRSTVTSIPQINLYSKIIASISKSKDWQYEKEWRFVAFSKTLVEKMKNRLPVPNPTAIYLGGKFELNSESDKMRLEKIIKSQKINVYKMQNHTSEYKLIKAI